MTFLYQQLHDLTMPVCMRIKNLELDSTTELHQTLLISCDIERVWDGYKMLGNRCLTVIYYTSIVPVISDNQLVV